MSDVQATAYPELDPWHPTVTALERIKSVVAGHLAEMFLDGGNDEVRGWARGIADELRRAEVGIDDLIVRRLRSLTLGPASGDSHPF